MRTLSAPASWSRARIGTARIDSYSDSGRFGNSFQRGSRCASAAIATGRRSAAAVPVIPSRRGAVGGVSSHRAACRASRGGRARRGVVVEVDEACVGLERSGDLLGDEVEHLLEVERRVDRRARFGQQPQVRSFGAIAPEYRRRQ